MTKAQIIIGVVLSILAGILVGHWICTWLAKAEAESQQEISLPDSILYHAEKEQLHTDSAKIHHEKWEQAWKIYIDTVNIKSAHWDTIRAKYKRDLREKIRRSAPGFSDSLRSAQTSNLSPAARK